MRIFLLLFFCVTAVHAAPNPGDSNYVDGRYIGPSGSGNTPADLSHLRNPPHREGYQSHVLGLATNPSPHSGGSGSSHAPLPGASVHANNLNNMFGMLSGPQRQIRVRGSAPSK